MTEVPNAFARKLEERRKRAEKGLVKAQNRTSQSKSKPDDAFDEDLIPDVGYEKSEVEAEIDRIVASVDVLDAYGRWCGKMKPKVLRGQRENIMISCPIPGHTDSEPSAWLNLDKQVWFCGRCERGGDAHDLAAYCYGYSVPGYKKDGTFAKLRRQMAEDFGLVTGTMPGGEEYVVTDEAAPRPKPTHSEPAPRATQGRRIAAPKVRMAGPATSEAQGDEAEAPEEAEQEEAAPAPESDTETDAEPDAESDAEPEADVITLYGDEEDGREFPSLDWRKIVPEDTFLQKYMDVCCQDDSAEEFHFWNGLIALGFAMGRNTRLWDTVPVLANLFVCTLGRSGAGKSKARNHLSRLLAAALPHDWSDPSSRGVTVISSPGSAEVLIKSFQKPVTDPANPKKVLYLAPVAGLVDFNELSQIVGRASRKGNVLKPTLMQFYDGEDRIASISLSTGTKEAYMPFGSCLTTSQPGSIRDLVGEADDVSGFLNRWVFVGGPEKTRIAIGGVRVDVGPAVEPLRAVLAWSNKFMAEDYIFWSPEATEVFTDWFHKVAEPAKKQSQSDLLVRIDLTMKKIILLLSGNKMEDLVSEETVREALSVFEYLQGCYRILGESISLRISDEIENALLQAAMKSHKDTGQGASIRMLTRSVSSRFPREQVLRAIETLTKLGLLELEKSPPSSKGGRPTVRYRYVP